MEKITFVTDEKRGIDRTILPANDCSRIQNAPKTNAVPSWWLEVWAQSDDPEDRLLLQQALTSINAGKKVIE